MRIVPNLCLISALAAVAASLAAPGAVGSPLINNKSVQEELKLSRDQLEQIKNVPQQVFEKHHKEYSALRKQTEALLDKQRKLAADRTEATAQAMLKALKPAQVKRFNEMEFQVRGLGAFADPAVQKDLDLTGEQKNAIKDLRAELDKTINNLRSEALRDRKKIASLQGNIAAATKETEDKIFAKLNAGQKKSWKKMTGTPSREAAKYAALGFEFNSFAFARVKMLSDEGLQKELKVSAEQQDKIIKAAKEVADRYRKKLAEAKKELEAFFQKSDEFRKKMSEAKTRAIVAILKPAQRERLRQIEVQQLGIKAFTDPEVQTQLKLTEDQKKDMKAVFAKLVKDIDAALTGVGGDQKKYAAARKKVDALIREIQEKMVAKLTDEQKKTWKKMVGTPFELKTELAPN
jgi:hypothetical protein